MIKIAIVGDPFVGKSSIIRSYFGDRFSKEYKPGL